MPIGTLRATNPPWDRTIKFSVCMLLSTLMLGLTACGQNTAPATSANPLSDPRSLATSASADGRFSVDAPASAAGDREKLKGPFGDIAPLEIRQGGALGSLGLNLDTYFSGNLNDTGARLDRLEGAVTAMHRDLKILAPSMQRLALIETDLQDLVGQLEAMLQEGSVDAAPVAAYAPPTPIDAPAPQDAANAIAEPAPSPTHTAPPPVTASAAQTPVAAPAAAAAAPPAATTTPAAGAPQISAVRFGGDGGKTRIVFDGNQPLTYTKDLDNGEKLLVIEVANAGWGAAAQGTAPKSSVIDSWSAQDNGSGGTRIIMALKSPVSVSYDGTMKPESGNPHHRIVIDLRPE